MDCVVIRVQALFAQGNKMRKEDVEATTIYLTLAGSRAYGTNQEDSDWDYRGVCIPTDKTYYIGTGLNRFEQMDKGFDDDRVVYDLRKFLSLASDGNPNILELLFVGQDKWIQTSTTWEKIVAHKDCFLSKQVRHRFGGYSYAQLKRIKNHRRYLLNPPTKHPERSDFGLGPDKALKAEDLGAFEWLLASLLKGNVQAINVSDEAKEELRALSYIGLVQSNMAGELEDKQWSIIQGITGASDEFMAMMYKEKAYINAMNDWSAYENWHNKRNEKRRLLEEKYRYDTKHAMHLIRLSRMCVEILEGKGVIVCRPDAEELKAIRNGAWTFEQVEAYAEEMDKKAAELYNTTTLPTKPNRVFIDQLCQDIIEDYVWEKQ